MTCLENNHDHLPVSRLLAASLIIKARNFRVFHTVSSKTCTRTFAYGRFVVMESEKEMVS